VEPTFARMETRTRIPPLNELPSLEVARQSGQPWCNRGRPCRHGHLAPWNWRHGYCRTCLYEKQARYEKTEFGRAAQRAAQARYQASDKGRTFEQNYQPTEAVRAYNRAYAAERYAAEMAATPGWLNDEQKAQILAIYRDAASRDTLHHVDHIVPIKGNAVCGLHVPWNLRVIPAAENLSKGNRFKGGW
jgi:hypothetical protein